MKTLSQAIFDSGLPLGPEEVQKFIQNKQIMVNGKLAISWDQVVYIGDVIVFGKTKSYLVR